MRYYDNTRISSYRECPRKYYFRHVKHWIADRETPVPLVFGLSWHDAMDVVWALSCDGGIPDNDLAEAAFKAFGKTWLENGMPSAKDFNDNPGLYDVFKQRTPMIAYEMLDNYIRQRREFIRAHRVIAIEQPFVVDLPGNEEAKYVGRLDKVIMEEHTERVQIIEHKTTSAYAKDGGFRRDYIDSYSPNSQVDGYLHASHSTWGRRVKGVMIDAALVHKTVHDAFKFIPVDRQTSALENFINEVNAWIARIVNEEVFPKNTDACWSYGSKCGYSDLCKFYNKPGMLNDTPAGFKVEKWEPYEILELEKLNLPKEEAA